VRAAATTKLLIIGIVPFEDPALSCNLPERRMNRCGQEFDDELIVQFNVLPQFIADCGFRERQSPGIRGGRLSRGRSHAEERLGGDILVASGIGMLSARFAKHDNPLPVAGRRNSAHRARIGPAALSRRSRTIAGTSLRSAVILPTNYLARPGSG
jgi:hypothetical protein